MRVLPDIMTTLLGDGDTRELHFVMNLDVMVMVMMRVDQLKGWQVDEFHDLVAFVIYYGALLTACLT